MTENYINLCVFNFGKRCYVVMKNGDKVLYFESVNGTYVMPVTSFNLFDNQGKSLTVVNQHFFISQLVNRINIDLKKGNFLNDDEIVSFLNDVKATIESDDYLIKLFKGSLMGEINEANFESNKREIVKYLDKFKINNFVDYNNFSIFTGSLEKVSNDDNQVEASVTDDVEIEEVVDSENTEVEEVNENVVVEENNLESVEIEEVIDDSSIEEIDTNSLDVSVPTFSLNINFEGVKSNDVDVVDSSVSQNVIDSDDVDDLFDTMLSDINSGVGSGNLSNIDYNDVIVNAHDAINDDDFYQQPIINDSVQSAFSSNEGPGFMPSSDFNAGLNNTEQPVINEQPVLNESVQPVGEQFDVFEPNANVDLSKNVISDKNDLPDLDSVSDSVNNKKSKGGKKIGIVFFMIFLIVLLMVGAYFIYFKVLS